MEILLVRHAIARERDPAKWPDDRGRPLTRDGALRFSSVAQVLARTWEAPDLVLSSPLARAWQTAQILEEACSWPEPQECPSLAPERRPVEVIAALGKRAGAGRIVFVGHEPSLHELLALFLGGSDDCMSLEMKKGGAALVRFAGAVSAGAGSLVWLLPPRLLLAAAGD